MDINHFEVLVVVLAGGEGSRLNPLTATRSKPAVPIGGMYRLIDIPLSNACHSRFRKIIVLTQGRDKSLNRHIKNTWVSDIKLESSINIISPQGVGITYKGDADAVRQIMDDIDYYEPDFILIVPGDHLVKMNYYSFIRFLAEKQADAAISIIPRPLHMAGHFGSLMINENEKVTDFREKDAENPLKAGTADYFYASMGIYAFTSRALRQALKMKGNLFGKDIIPQLLSKIDVAGYDYEKNNKIREHILVYEEGHLQEKLVDTSPDSHYWRDVGTIAEYFESNMDLVSISPKFNLYGKEWPFYTLDIPLGPTKIVNPHRQGFIESAILGEGSILSDVIGRNIVISPQVYIEKTNLQDCVVFNDVKINNCSLQRTIVDKHVHLSNMQSGYNIEADKARGIFIDETSGIRVIAKGAEIYG